MKKILTGIVCLLAPVLLFADSSSAIEGIVEVAAKDELPAGYFGKAAGYLPGDTVSIVNPQTGFILQILNLGTLDASEGTAVLLSQESARSLGLEGTSGVRVRLEPRSVFFDETAAGKAVLDKSTVPEKKSSLPAAERSSQPLEQKAAVPVVTEESEAEEPAQNEVMPEIPEENETAEDDFAAEEESLDAEEEIFVAAEEVPEVEAVEENEEPQADFPEREECPEEDEAGALQEFRSEVPQQLNETAASQEPVIVEGPAGEPSVPEQEVVVVELPALEQEIPAEDYESEEDSFIESRIAVGQPSPAEAEEEAFTAEEIECGEIEAEEFEAEELSPAENPEAPQEAEEAVSEAYEEEAEECEAEAVSDERESENEAETPAAEGYEPIILVPAEPEASPAVPPQAENAEPPAKREDIAPQAESSAQDVPFSLERYIVSSESDLETGCYYIQIATLRSEKNIEAALSAYSKYPIVLVPNKKDAYRMLVGPLSVDEYGAVLAKFKEAGFTDAFVKKR